MKLRTRRYTIDKIENGAIIRGSMVDTNRETTFAKLVDILMYICGDIAHNNLPEGDITEIKATLDKDGSVLVCVTGNRDRIFGKVEVAE